MNIGWQKAHKGPLRDILAKNMRRLRATRGLTHSSKTARHCGDQAKSLFNSSLRASFPARLAATVVSK